MSSGTVAGLRGGNGGRRSSRRCTDTLVLMSTFDMYAVCRCRGVRRAFRLISNDGVEYKDLTDLTLACPPVLCRSKKGVLSGPLSRRGYRCPDLWVCDSTIDDATTRRRDANMLSCEHPNILFALGHCLFIPPPTGPTIVDMTTFRAFSVALLACLAIASTAFQPANSRVVGSARPFIGRSVSTKLHEKNSPKSEFEVGEDEYSGDIDWDSEWQKVVKEQDSGKEKRPSGNYKSDAERAAIRATNKVAEQVAKVKVQPPSFKAPEIRSLQGDWKFWIGILALISIGTSLLAASGQSATYTSDSFYI